MAGGSRMSVVVRRVDPRVVNAVPQGGEQADIGDPAVLEKSTYPLVDLPLLPKLLTKACMLSQVRVGLDQGLVHTLLRRDEGDEESHARGIAEPRHGLELKERETKA